MIRLVFFVFMVALPVAAQIASPVAVPMHGNWCGPGHPSVPALAGPPVDRLDAICRKHDICVANDGLLNCGCDIAFLQELRGTPWPDPRAEFRARAIYDAMAMIPCTDPYGTAQKQAMFMQDWMFDTLSGRRPASDVFLRLQALGQHSMERLLFDRGFR